MAKKEIKKSRKSAPKAAPSLASHAEQAVKDYERAVALLHQKDYGEAAKRFQSIIADYPTEKEMADRCRLYIRACEKNLNDKAPALKKSDDFYYQGIVEGNRQQFDQALEHLEKALHLSPSDDRIVYVMASTLALKGEKDQALSKLREAIEINPGNRIQAQQDPDFESVREDAGFLDLVSPAEN